MVYKSFRIPFCVFISIFILSFAPSAFADSITLSGDTGTYADADEYFTDVLADPREGDSNCDVPQRGWYYSPIASTNGVWTGTNPSTAGTALSYLPVPTQGSLLHTWEDCGRIGVVNTIDPSKYSHISWKQRVSASGSHSVLWSYTDASTVNGFSDLTGYFLPAAAVQPTSSQFELIQEDLSAMAPSTTPWSGTITGLAINPSITLPAGSTTEIDFLRLIDPDSSPTIDFSWSGSTDAVIGENGVEGVGALLFVDDDNSGFDGQRLTSFQNGVSGSYEFMTGLLPPGTYYFYVELYTHNNLTPTRTARSGYVGPVIINDKPVINFTSPTRMSGRAYSRDERGDPWDMNSISDTTNLEVNGVPNDQLFHGLSNWTFSDGIMTATSFPDSDGEGTGVVVDTNVQFTVPSNKPVDTNLYRWFCYRMELSNEHIPRDGNATELNEAGWVARLVGIQNNADNTLFSTKAGESLEASTTYPDNDNGFVTYCIDLHDEDNYESGVRWRTASFMKTIRFDPMEATPATEFRLDWAELYAENAESNDAYTIGWDVTDDDSSLTISIYYDSNNSGFDGTLITTLSGQEAGTGSHVWDTSGVADGSYYIYLVVSDGTNTARRYSEEYVNIGAAASTTPVRAPGDFDGDGKTDFTIIREIPSTGGRTNWYTYNSGNGASSVTEFGNLTLDLYMDMDSDGDRTTDRTIVRALRTDAITWTSTLTFTPSTREIGWGILQDIPVPGVDLDGDGKTDETIFRPSDGSWWSVRSTLGAIAFFWGAAGDLPAAADFDGDGWSDIGIFRNSDGYWWLTQSSRGASTAPADIIFRQFGLPGDHPMPGDYDGDGKADLVLWREVNGYWFVCSSRTDFDCSQATATQFGLPGDEPIKADFDGDGILDKAVFRENGGYWFWIQSSDGQIGIRQWGLNGDIPHTLGIRGHMERLQ